MKKLFEFLLITVCLILFFSGGCKKHREHTPEVTLKLAHSLDVTHPVHKGMVYMAQTGWEK